MNNHAIAVSIAIVGFAIWSVLHSLGASLKVKAWLNRRLGPLFRYYTLAYVGVSILTLALFFALLPPIEGDVYVVIGPGRYLLRLVQLAAAIGFAKAVTEFDVWGFLGLRAFGQGAAKPEKTLIRTGLYAFCRHPLYFFGLLFLWANPSMTARSFWVTVAFTGYLLVGTVFEERKLALEFGPAYLAYKREVSRMFPAKWLLRLVGLGRPN